MPTPNVLEPVSLTPAQETPSPDRELTEQELAEAKESLRRYFEIGWKIACRLQREGKLDEVLTKAGVNPTVKPPQADAVQTDHSQTST
jgi:hypothetical protein